MIIGILKETVEGEFRVAATPETVKKFTTLKHEVFIESNAGLSASITDQMFIDAGALIKGNTDVFKADILLKVRAPNTQEIEKLSTNQVIVGLLEPFNKELTAQLATKKVTAFSLESLPRNTRAQAMDVLSSQANIAGYKAVILAADYYKKFLPMLMTAAGTVKAARILVLGAGVAGLQAIATAKRLGAVVEASDVRPAVKEQIESLGAKFVDVPYETEEEKNNASGEGGYAKPMPKSWLDRQSKLVAEKAITSDIIITSALIPGKEPPKLITLETIHKMKQGSVIVDMAAGLANDGSGNCPVSEENKIVDVKGITIIGLNNLPSLLSNDASSLYSRNIFEFTKLLFNDEGKLFLNREDELVSGALLTSEGNLIN